MSDQAARRLVITELSQAAAHDLTAWMDAGHPLRGAYMQLRREGNRPNGRLRAELQAGRNELERLPPEIDVRAALLRIWRLHDSHDGMDNPEWAAEAAKILQIPNDKTA